MKVVGIDPGIYATGYGVIDATDGGRVKVVEAGVIRPDRKLSLAERLNQLHEGVAELLQTYAADVMAVESLYSHYKHPRTAVIMGHARGAVLLAAAQAGVPVQDYAPNRIKKSLTGNGHASKEQVQRMAQVELSLPRLPEPPDVADALACALCHVRALREGKARS